MENNFCKPFFSLIMVMICLESGSCKTNESFTVDEGIDKGAKEMNFENLSSFPASPYTSYSDIFTTAWPMAIQLPGSVIHQSSMVSVTLSKGSYYNQNKQSEIYKHFSVYTDSKGDSWIRFCVDTDNEAGTSSGSDYLRSEISEGYISESDSSIKSSKGYTFEFEGTFRINTSHLSGNETYIPGTAARSGDKIDFCQLHEEREQNFTNGKHNPPTLQIHVRNNNAVCLNYCPDRKNYIDTTNPNDIKPGTKSVTLYENYKSLEEIKIRFKYTGTNLYVWVNNELKFDANENTKKVFGSGTTYTMYENENSYIKFGCYANTWKGFQTVYVKDITAKVYKTGTSAEDAQNHWVKK
jgi:hypothetical protein